MDKKIGFIGSGNMAKAIIKGLIDSGFTKADKIMASNRTRPKLDALQEKHAIKITLNNKELAGFADVLILSVKPNKFEEVIKEIKDDIKKDTVVISIAAGISINRIKEYFGRELKIIRTIPNTPAAVGEAMTSLCHNELLNKDEKQYVIKLFSSFGKVEVIEEGLMDVASALAGSSPALTYMYIEALADGGVLKGLPRDKAYKMAAQAVLGAAKMVLESQSHPGELKDNVCSPGGTTIEAVYALERGGFRASIIEAISESTEKAERL